MKKFTFLLVLLLVVGLTFTFAAKKDGNGAGLVSSSGDDTVLKFDIRTYDFKKVNTPTGEANELVVPGAGKILKKGAPALVRLTASAIVHDEARMKVEVLDAAFTEIRDIDIAPSKGLLFRTVDPDTVPYEYGAEYNRNVFYPKELVELNKPYIARDFRGQSVVVNAFRYNPVTKVLRVYTDVTVKLSPTGQKGENILKSRGKRMSPHFRDVYSNHFVNFETQESRYAPLDDSFGNMLIVCYNGFMTDMADFVTWKQGIGYGVDLVDYSTIGSSTALKTYVANYYNTNGLTFLLLVGDHAQVPTSSTSAGDSDNNYGYIVGSDHYQDIFVGRFSAEISAHVQTQVERTIHYERDVLSSADFFRHAIGMGSSEGTGDDGEYDYEHINYILDDLAGYGYTTHQCHQSGGSPTLMSSLINAGSGTIFYCGHGTVSGWYTSSWQYTSTNVNALVNEYELPFVISVACVVGDFTTNTCYCEVWQRATNNGNPTGSVAHCGSTVNQSWNPPMCAEDEMADLLVAGSVRTFGGMFVNGMFQMNDEYGGGGEDMTDTWVCFGDPSVQLRTPGTPDGPTSSGNIPPNANFSFTTNLLEVTFTDLSSDPDGSVVSWAWDFGDTGTSTLQNPVHTYAGNGTYSVTLTVTDNEGATDPVTKDVTVSDGTTPEMYVDDIAMSISRTGRNYKATGVVTIRDTENNVVPNATVYITWSGVASGSASGVTGADGKVSFTSARVKSAGPFTITVTNVTHATFDYNSSLNNETSDSITY
jgi:PKD repeat protein